MHPVSRKLSNFIELSREEASALELAFANTFRVSAGQAIVREAEQARSIVFVLDGLALRSKRLPEGERQVVAFLLPGDHCDIGGTILGMSDTTIEAQTECVVGRASSDALDHLCAQYDRIAAGLRWATLVEEAISREWIVNVGRRPAVKRVAHLFCETYYRACAIGRENGTGCDLPLSQADLGDATGMSVVHVNRCLQQLRRDRLVAFGDKRLTILDLPGIEDFCGFDATYLHLDAHYEPGGASAREA